MLFPCDLSHIECFVGKKVKYLNSYPFTVFPRFGHILQILPVQRVAYPVDEYNTLRESILIVRKRKTIEVALDKI